MNGSSFRVLPIKGIQPVWYSDCYKALLSLPIFCLLKCLLIFLPTPHSTKLQRNMQQIVTSAVRTVMSTIKRPSTKFGVASSNSISPASISSSTLLRVSSAKQGVLYRLISQTIREKIHRPKNLIIIVVISGPDLWLSTGAWRPDKAPYEPQGRSKLPKILTWHIQMKQA